MGLENEVIETFINEVRKNGRLKETTLTTLQALLNKRSITKKNLMELIEANADSKDKKH